MATKQDKAVLRPDAETLREVLAAHTAWLRSGGEAGERAVLVNADLSHLDMSGACLEKASLAGADLTGTDLSEAVLDRADLSRVQGGGVDLSNASLVATNLTWATLSDARLTSATLTGACLSDADLTRARLKNADFTNAELDGADLRGTDITGVVLTGTDLTGTVFDHTPLSDAGMDEAYEADEILGETALAAENEPVSELPDADLEAGPVAVGGEAWPGRAPVSAPRPPAPPAAAAPAAGPDIAQVLRDHARWVKSRGREGSRADLRHADLSGQALDGGSALEGARLGGADLSGAALPDGVGQRVAQASRLIRIVRMMHLALLFACGYVFLVMGVGTGHGTFTHRMVLYLPVFGVNLPLPVFFISTPLLLAAAYLYQLAYLQRLWEELAELPARFPDGRPVDRFLAPWLPLGLATRHFPQLEGDRRPLQRVQLELSGLLLWGAVPGTVALLWGGGLALGVSAGASAYLGLLVAASTGAAVYSFLLTRRTIGGGPQP